MRQLTPSAATPTGGFAGLHDRRGLIRTLRRFGRVTTIVLIAVIAGWVAWVAAPPAAGQRGAPALGKLPQLFPGVQRGPVEEFSWSPDGNVLAVLRDGQVVLWDVATSQPRYMPWPPAFRAHAFAWSPDSRRLAIAGAELAPEALIHTRVWGIAEQRQLALLPDSGGPLAWSPDGRFLAAFSVAGEDEVQLWDAVSYRAAARFSLAKSEPQEFLSTDIRELKWSADSARLAVRLNPSGVCVWDVRRRRLGLEIRAAGPMSWSGDGLSLATLAHDRICTWDVRSGRQGAVLGPLLPRPLNESEEKTPEIQALLDETDELRWQPRGSLVAVLRQRLPVEVWDTATGELAARVDGAGERGQPQGIGWRADGRLLAVGLDESILLWDPAARRAQAVLRGPLRGYRLAWSPVAESLAVGEDEQPASIWKPPYRSPSGELIGHLDRMHEVAWSPDGKHLATGTGWQPHPRGLCWQIAGEPSARALAAPPTPGPPGVDSPTSIQEIRWSADGTALAALLAEDMGFPWSWAGDIGLWRLDALAAQGLPGQRLDDAGGPALWSPRGEALATAAPQRTRNPTVAPDAALWSAGGTRRLPLRGAAAPLAWSPDGAVLAVRASDGEVELRDAASGAVPARLERARWIRLLSWSPNGAVLAGGAGEGAVLWDAGTGRERAELKGHTAGVTRLAWSPDGAILATAAARESSLGTESADRRVILWDGRTGERRAVLAGHTGAVNEMAWRPDGGQLATIGGGRWLGDQHGQGWFTGDGDRRVILWDPRTGKQQAVLNAHRDAVENLAWSPDGKTLVSASTTGELCFWRAGTLLARRQAAPETAPLGGVDALQWDPTGAILAAAAGGAVTLWRRDGRPTAMLSSLDGGKEWVIATPEGWVAGSPGAAALVQWREGRQRWPGQKYWDRFEQPARLRAALERGK